MSQKFCCQTVARNSTVKLYRKCWKSTALRTESPCHILPNRMVQQSKKIIHMWKALILCFTPVDCQKNCGLKPVILQYTYHHTGPTPVEGKTPLELWTGSCETLGHLRVFGTECYVHIPTQKRHKWDQKSRLGQLVGYMGEKDGYRIWIPNERKIVLSRDVLFKPGAVCNSRNDITRTESTCPTLHVVPTEEIQVLQNYKCDNGNTASTSGGSNGLNAERYVQDRKSIREKKQPN